MQDHPPGTDAAMAALAAHAGLDLSPERAAAAAAILAAWMPAAHELNRKMSAPAQSVLPDLITIIGTLTKQRAKSQSVQDIRAVLAMGSTRNTLTSC